MITAKRQNVSFLLAGLFLIVAATQGYAASATASVNINITIPSSSNLTLGATNLNFTANDSTLQPTVPATENPVSVVARVVSRGTPSLTVVASDDLKDGQNVIPVSALSWTADAAPFINGTLSKATPQQAAAMATGSGKYTSSFRFFLANSDFYLPGTYSTTINYTLTAP
jgi:hypothetical protein